MEYIGGIVRSQNRILISAGGVGDHIPLLTSLEREVSLGDLMRFIKSRSSKWIDETFPEYPFAWPVGYGAFGVSLTQIEPGRADIARHKEHHATHSYQDEYRELLRRHGLEWDDRYLWD